MATLAAAVALVVAAACFLSATAQPPPYTNFTVGGTAGWVLDPATGKPAADYAAWASNQSFFLGDYLIFNTNANSTVIQTYNKTTYGLLVATPPPPPPIEATPSSQNEVFYNGGDRGRGAEGRLAVAFSVGVMGLLVAAAVVPGANAVTGC